MPSTIRAIQLILILVFLSSGIPLSGYDYKNIGESRDTLASIDPDNSDSPDDIPQNSSLDGNISIAWENDLYYRHDCYFTNGFQVDFFHDRLLILTSKKRQRDSYSGLQLRQEIFTPKDLGTDTISIGDHPYSANLTLTHVSVLDMSEKLMRIVSEIKLGVLGPASLGFRTQEMG